MARDPHPAFAKAPIRSLAVLLAFSAGCTTTVPQPAAPPSKTETAEEASFEEPPVSAVVDAPATEGERIAAFFEHVFAGEVARSPERQTRLGLKRDQDKWDQRTEEREARELLITEANLARLRSEFHLEELDSQAELSYRLFEYMAERDIEGWRWRLHQYPMTPLDGIHSRIPSFLISFHVVQSVRDAEAYIERIRRVPRVVDQTIARLERCAEAGIIFPRFGYPEMIDTALGVLAGAPFEEGEDSTLLADFRAKVGALDIDKSERERLLGAASIAMTESLQPAYLDLIAYLENLEARAGDEHGVWRLPNGGDYYDWTLRLYTTTSLNAGQIHDLGLAEVARIHRRMAEVMREAGHEGSLSEFFEFMRTDPRFYLPDTPEGRERYLERAVAVIEEMRSLLPGLFDLRPAAGLVVRRVEPFREPTSARAFYQQPSADGSRPATYYVNLYRMADMPTYQLQALAYHEGIPGHHMQVAIAQELEELPRFRRFARFTAYTEGWALYAELLPKELGLYSDPYQDFGRLAGELWRACRLVVDTGIHWKRWNREQAVRYLLDNTPNPEGDIRRAVDRYISWPGQATAYTIGMLRILELRRRAAETLGARFDLREFHDALLRDGPLPLGLLEEKVDEWLAEESDTGA